MRCRIDSYSSIGTDGGRSQGKQYCQHLERKGSLTKVDSLGGGEGSRHAPSGTEDADEDDT